MSPDAVIQWCLAGLMVCITVCGGVLVVALICSGLKGKFK
jgi:hypothetical protein